MDIVSLVLGIVSLLGVCLALVPLLNVLNCITLPLALFGAIFGLVDLLRQKPEGKSKGIAIAGLVINLLALGVGAVRFVISLLTTGGIV